MTENPFSFGVSVTSGAAGADVDVVGTATEVAAGAEGGCVVVPFVSVVVVSPELLSPLTGTIVSVEMVIGSVLVAVDVLVEVASIVFSFTDT